MFDNDSVFINETLVQYCAGRGIEFTRSRAYPSNDQAWIEQKNGSVVRRFVGHDRYPARSPDSCLKRARTVAGANQARILQVRASAAPEVEMTEAGTYVGIDVAKANIDIAVRPTGRVWPASYDAAGIDAAGIEELVSQLEELTPNTVLLEATGGLEVPLAAALAAALPVVVVNPRQVRDFAKATGQLAKTDALDAQVRAHFAEAVRPSIPPLRYARCGTPTPRNSTH